MPLNPLTNFSIITIITATFAFVIANNDPYYLEFVIFKKNTIILCMKQIYNLDNFIHLSFPAQKFFLWYKKFSLAHVKNSQSFAPLFFVQQLLKRLKHFKCKTNSWLLLCSSLFFKSTRTRTLTFQHFFTIS